MHRRQRPPPPPPPPPETTIRRRRLSASRAVRRRNARRAAMAADGQRVAQATAGLLCWTAAEEGLACHFDSSSSPPSPDLTATRVQRLKTLRANIFRSERFCRIVLREQPSSTVASTLLGSAGCCYFSLRSDRTGTLDSTVGATLI